MGTIVFNHYVALKRKSNFELLSSLYDLVELHNLYQSIALELSMNLRIILIGSGRPSDAVCEENCHAVENIVMQNRRVNVHQIADTVGINTGSVKTILHEHLFMTKVCARWGPECLTRK